MKRIYFSSIALFFAFSTNLVAMPTAPLQTTPPMPTAQPQPTMTTTPQPQPMTTTPPQPQPTPAQAPEFDQIATALAQLQSARVAIADAMKNLDEKMQSARNDTAQAKKISLSILSKSNEAEAKAALDQVNALLQKMQTYQTDVQNQTSKTIDQNYNQMQTQFATIQEKIRNLQARGVTLQIAEAQTIITKAESTFKELKKQTEPTKSAMPASKSVIHTFFSGIADWIMAGFKSIHEVYKSIIDYVIGSPTPSADTDQKKKSNNDTATNQGVAQSQATPDKVRDLLNQCDQCTKALEFSYISLQERSLRLEEAITNWGKSSPVFARLTKLEMGTYESYGSTESHFRHAIIGVFSWALDGCLAVLSPVAWVLKTIYQKTIGWFVTKVISDVSNKVQTAEEKPAPQPSGATK
ncbi:MAG: hypothetical protein WCT20_02490 [Candidatus Babeliales bacterium]